MSYNNLRDFELHRTPYDKIMLKMYNPQYRFTNLSYPMPRTQYDVNMQKIWCPQCIDQFEYYEYFENLKSFQEDFIMNFNKLI
jgi:hypothetical protein